MAVTGTPVTSGSGRTLADIFAGIIARPVSAMLGISPGLLGKVSRDRLLVLINEVYRDLSNDFLNLYAVELTLTTSYTYDVSEAYSPAVTKIIDVRFPQSSSGQYVSSVRWNHDIEQGLLQFHVQPLSGSTCELIYHSLPADLSSDEDAILGELIGKENIIIDGVLGKLGDTRSWASYSNSKKMDVPTRGRKLTFPRRMR